MEKSAKTQPSVPFRMLALFSLALGITAASLYQWWLANFTYFLIDRPGSIQSSIFPFATVSQNDNFELCDKMGFLCSYKATEIISKMIWNTFFIGLWAAQHSQQGQLPIRNLMMKITPLYAVVERSVFACTALITQFMLLYLWQPLVYLEFELPSFLMNIFWGIVTVAMILYVITMVVQKNDVWGIYKAIGFLYSTQGFPYHPNDQKVFMFMRNPRQVAQISLLLFTAVHFNLGRIQFITFLTGGIFITIFFVDRRNSRQPLYREYKSVVKNIFIPQIPKKLPDYQKVKN